MDGMDCWMVLRTFGHIYMVNRFVLQQNIFNARVFVLSSKTEWLTTMSICISQENLVWLLVIGAERWGALNLLFFKNNYWRRNGSTDNL